MKLKVSHSKYIAGSIAIELNRSNYLTMKKGLDIVIDLIESHIIENLQNERALEERVREMMEDYEDEIEYNFADERELFRMIKKKLAPKYNFLISQEDRFDDLSHKIIRSLISKDLVDLKVTEIRVKSLIFETIQNYIHDKFDLEDKVVEKIKNYKKRVIPGTDEYQILFDKLYEHELKAKGIKI